MNKKRRYVPLLFCINQKSFQYLQKLREKLQISSEVFGIHRNIFGNVRQNGENLGSSKNVFGNLTHLTQEKLAGIRY